MKMESAFAPAKSTRKRLWSGALVASAVAAALGLAAPAEAQTRTLNMQSSWPANSTAQEAFKMFADRVDKMTGGSLKITTSPAGTVVPAFEVLDATHKKVLDGTHTISYYWIGKNKAATLFSNTPAGIVGMDQMDYIGWLYEGGGMDLYWEFYQKELKLNLIAFPLHAPSPQALGWFRKPITGLADFKGMKCRQTGITAELYAKMGMAVVNMPGGEIIPSAQRGVIDCAEWVGGVEDLRLGFHNVWKYHYTPGVHENVTIGEILINGDVWKSLKPEHQELIKTVASETFVIWWAKWQRQNADALKELQEKHGVRILRTPGDILIEFLKTWDKIAAEESQKSPFFKKTLESQRQYASLVVPAKRFMFPPYSFVANYYFPERAAGGAKADAKKK